MGKSLVQNMLVLLFLAVVVQAQEQSSKLDKKFYIERGIHLTALSLDIGTTLNFKNRNCQETVMNPIVGRSPQKAILIPAIAEFGTATLVSHILKKKHKSYWFLPGAMLSGAHLTGFGISQKNGCGL